MAKKTATQLNREITEALTQAPRKGGLRCTGGLQAFNLLLGHGNLLFSR
jgi:hypothetical protein